MHRQWRRGLAPDAACPWCNADDTNLHMLCCVPDGPDFVHQQQSALLDSLSSKNPRSRQGLVQLKDRRQFTLGRPVPAPVQVEVPVRAALNELMNAAAFYSTLIGALTPSLVHIASRPRQTALHMMERAWARYRECMRARRLRQHRPLAGQFHGAPP